VEQAAPRSKLLLLQPPAFLLLFLRPELELAAHPLRPPLLLPLFLLSSKARQGRQQAQVRGMLPVPFTTKLRAAGDGQAEHGEGDDDEDGEGDDDGSDGDGKDEKTPTKNKRGVLLLLFAFVVYALKGAFVNSLRRPQGARSWRIQKKEGS
jgi:hypothetical protein